jgi:hypothetical protein
VAELFVPRRVSGGVNGSAVQLHIEPLEAPPDGRETLT